MFGERSTMRKMRGIEKKLTSIIMNICAPGKYDSKNNTCFSIEQLTEMAEAYNRYIAKSATKVAPIKIKADKKYLLNELLNRFDTVCQKKEVCLTKQAFMNEIVGEMRNTIENKTFRPVGPENPTQWLSTTDINKILQQYEDIYPDFKFLGAVPLNCEELSFCSLYQLDFEDYLKKGFSRLAIVFNLDKYGSPGSHWVALYINSSTGEIYYCDSAGNPPRENTTKIINSFKNYYLKKTGKEAIYKYNKNRYQKDKSECSIYSCNFIIRSLAGEKFDDIVNSSLDFEEINSCRNVYLQNKSSKFHPHDKCDP